MKRWTLRLLVASIAISGLFGIWALVFGEFGEVQARVLWTSLCVTGATLFISACALAWERYRRDVAPLLGILAALIGYGMLALAVWVDVGSECYFQVALAAVLSSHAGLIITRGPDDLPHFLALPAALDRPCARRPGHCGHGLHRPGRDPAPHESLAADC
jgi:peptidoglycan/LPS O-acetylase OafA/YrhL